MPLYKPSNTAELAQSAMNGATQAAAAQTKQTGTRTEKDTSVLDDIYKGAAAVAYVGRGLDGLTDAAQGAMKLYDQHKLKTAYDDVDKAYREGGMGAVQQLDTNFWNNTAIGQFMKDRANNEKGRLEMMQNADAVADKIYKDWRVQASGVAKAYQSGDMQQFMPLMKQLSEQSPLPYKLEPDQGGNFKVLFRSDEKGGWTDTGRQMTPQEAMGEVNSVMRGEQVIARGLTGELLPVNRDFNLAVGRNILATAHGNADNRTDPRKVIPLYDKNGNVGGFARIQNPIPTEDNPYAYTENSKVIAFGHDGKSLGVFDGYDGVMKYGLSPFAPKKGKGGTKGGAAGEGGGYSLTQGDMSMLQKYATSENEMGEKTVDYGKAAFLEQFVRSKGLSPTQAIYVFDENVKRAMKLGATREQAERATMSLLSRPTSNGQQGQSPQAAQQAPAQQPQQQNPKAQGRIQEVLGLGLQGNAQEARNGGSGGAPATLSGNYRDNLERQANTRQALAESGDYPTEIVGLPGLGINSSALVEGDNVRGQGMLSGIGLRPSPFGQTESQKWRQHFNR